MEPDILYATTPDGVRLALYALGEGPALLVLPVLPMSHLLAERQYPEFTTFMGRMAAGRTLVRYDPRGIGLSARDAPDMSLDAHLSDILTVLDRLELDSASLFAAAYAGPLALAFAARHPARVEHLLLWSTHACFAEVEANVPEGQRAQREAVLGLARIDPTLAVQTYVHHAFGWSPDEAAAGFGMLALKSVDTAHFFPRLATYTAFDARPELAAVRAPTLVMHRSGFHASSPNVARALVSNIPSAELALFDGASVVPFIGDVEAVHDTIAAFLGAPQPSPLPPHARERAGNVQAILFSDIEGNTSMMEALGDEAGRAVLRVHEQITRRALRETDGTEIKTMGDGFLASFSSIQRALECAVEVQRELQKANADPASPLAAAAALGRDVRVRIGVNAGEPLNEDDDIFGTTVNAVARIAGQARGGEILVADVVRQLAAGKSFNFTDRGEVLLRGFNQAVRLHQLHWQPGEVPPRVTPRPVLLPGHLGAAAKLPAFAPTPTQEQFTRSPEFVPGAPRGTPAQVQPRLPLVGRWSELAEIESALVTAINGSGSACLVSGVAGIGKSRMIEETVTLGRARGAMVVRVSCDDSKFVPAMWPWVQVVREIEALLPPAEHERLSQGVGPGIERLLRAGTGQDLAQTLEATHGRFILYDAIDLYLRRTADYQPLVVAIDDIHRADESTLRLVDFLARRLGDSRMLVVAAFRDSFAGTGSPLLKMIEQVARQPGARRLTLRPLESRDLRVLLAAMLGREPDERLVERIVEQTGGNPFFASEVGRMLAESGTTPLSLRMPQSVRDAVVQRISPLPAPARRLLEFAAVQGREFNLATLARIPELRDASEPVLDALEPAEVERLVFEVPESPGHYRFEHALIREAVYEQLPSTRRARMHLAVAEALEGADRSRTINAELASHYVQGIAAGGAGRAFEYSVRAGDDARCFFAFEQALCHYSDALQAHGPAGRAASERAELIATIADVRTRSGDVSGGKESYREAMALARELDDRELIGRVALGYSEFIEAGIPDPERVTFVDDALKLFPPEDSALRARLLGLLGEVLSRGSQVDRKLAASASGLEMARRLDDPATLAYTLNTRLWALLNTPRLAERVSLAAEMLGLALDAGDETLALKARRWRVLNALEAGDVVVLKQETLAFERLAQHLREPVHLWRSASMQVGIEILNARWDGVERAISVVVERATAIQSRGAARFVGLQRFMTARSRGGLAALESIIAPIAGRDNSLPEMRMLFASVLLAAGHPEDARLQYEGAWEELRSRPLDRLGLANFCLLTELAVQFNDSGRFAQLRAELEPHAARNAIFGDMALVLGPASRFLGLLAQAERRWEDADSWFAEASLQARRLNAPALIAEVAADWGACLSASRLDPARGHELLEEALRLADAHALDGVRDAARAALAELAAEAPPALARQARRQLPAGLTTREAEVLQLLARGSTNKETADRLVLSVRTVERHIANVYTKIDAHTRAEATAFALHHGLL